MQKVSIETDRSTTDVAGMQAVQEIAHFTEQGLHNLRAEIVAKWGTDKARTAFITNIFEGAVYDYLAEHCDPAWPVRARR